MQTQESTIDMGKAVHADLVVTESNGTESTVQVDNSKSGNDTDADDAIIKPIYDEEPMAKVQLIAESNIFAIGQQHTEQPEIINDGRVDQYPEQRQVKSPMFDSSLDSQTNDYSKQSLASENSLLKQTVAQFQKDFSRMEAHCIALELKSQNQALKSGQHGQLLNDESNKAKIKKEIDVLETINIKLEYKVANFRKENETLKKHYKDLYDSIKITRSKTIEQTTSLLANNANLKAQIQEKIFAIAALKSDLRKLKGNSVDTKFTETSILGKPVLQPLRNKSVVRQPNAFKHERPPMSKQRFASQVDVNHNVSKPFTQHSLPMKSESAFAKPNQMIASSSSRNNSKKMSRFSSNDMVHNHYLDEAKKKTRERDRNSKPSMMTPTRFQSTTADSKPKPRSTNHFSRSLPINKPIDQKSHTQTPGRQIFTGHKFSSNKSFTVYKKTSPRSDLRWTPTGRIFKSVGFRWLPTGKLFNSYTSKVEREPTHGFNADISNIHECKQTLDLSAGTSINALVHNSSDPAPTRYSMASVQNSTDPGPTRQSMASAHNSSDLAPTCQAKASVQISSDPAPKCQTMVLKHGSLSPGRNCQENVSHRDKTGTTSNELDLLFSLMFDELLNGSSNVVSKSSATMALEHDSLSPGRKCQENVSHGDKTYTTSNELDLLFSPIFDELLNGSSKVVSKSSAVSAADALNHHQQQPTTPLNNHTSPAPTCQNPSIASSVTSNENINQAEPHAENDEVADDEFINIFLTPVQDQGETSSRHVDSLNMHNFYQRYPSEQRWTKDHPLEQVIGNPL
nr:hypothetical protein [Tanacetum cinerariifolium]